MLALKGVCESLYTEISVLIAFIVFHAIHPQQIKYHILSVDYNL